MNNVIGRCSICGGNVTIPEVWMSTRRPVPRCENCGAVADNGLPVIRMIPRKSREFRDFHIRRWLEEEFYHQWRVNRIYS